MDGISTLIWAIQQFNATQYGKVALISFFTADYFHTLATEITFLWPAPWTFVKTVFFVTRYSPFLDSAVTIAVITLSNPSVQICSRIIKINIWSSGIGQMSAQVLLIYRAYALLGRTRASAVFLSIFTLIVLGSGFMLLGELHRRLFVTPSPVPHLLPGCLITSSSSAENGFAIAGIIASIIYETILFFIIYWARMKKYREARNWLMRKIYGDALIYYLISLVISASGIIVWFSSTGPIRDLSSPVPRFLISIVSCRIILHIRKYGHEERRTSDMNSATDMGETLEALSRLHFRSPGRTLGADSELESP